METAVAGDRLLDIRDLRVEFHTLRGIVHALQGVSFHLCPGETLGLAGETGCGKSVTALAVLRLISPPGRITHGRIFFEGRDLLTLSEAEMRKLRGSQISMIMQEPKMSLNPVIRVGDQVAETLLIHDPTLNRRAAKAKAVEMLAGLGIPDASRMARRYPHELSGGMAQRVMIAMMLVTRPKLLIADEPTSALDVTIQAQILEVMKTLIREIGTAVLLITHDLGVMAETCDRVAVMYAGSVVELGPVRTVLKNPQHPYTQGLLKTIPDNVAPDLRLFSIRGTVPSLLQPAVGCAFAPRCDRAMERCGLESPPRYLLEADHHVACFLHRDRARAE
ncbi:MAG TPA: ABC transporter ATP-binding protein [Candidatus Methylomirabilis sp.]|nr:ABC transporter ATP-binding protein [Candidatus Methylomirabilis sp.]